MSNPDINKKYVLFYAVRGYATGQTVTIDIYDTVGTKEIDAGSMTELNATGIYTFNWFPRKRTQYLVVMDCATKPRQQHETIRVEKTKLSGAVHIPRVHPSFKDEEKKTLFDGIRKLIKTQDKIQETLPSLKTVVKPVQHILNLKPVEKQLASLKSKMASTDEHVKELNKFKLDFDSVRSELAKVTSNVIVLKELSDRASKAATDDASQNLELVSNLVVDRVTTELEKFKVIIDNIQVMQNV